MSEKVSTPRWIVSAPPHAHQGDSVRGIMLSVLVALAPAMAAALWFFGWDAARLTLVCVATCVAAEAVVRKAMGRDMAAGDLSAVVTGVLLAFNLPPSLPSWMAALGSAFAIVLAKQVFGGLGYNPFNPALIGRVMLLVSFPVAMTTWSSWQVPAPLAGADAMTTATPLGAWKMAMTTGAPAPFQFDSQTAIQFLEGARNGCIGEVSAAALVLGGLFLLFRRIIPWQIPVFYLGAAAAISGILWRVDPANNMPPLFHLLAGGLLLGAFFMATDMVTTPVTPLGRAIFGAGCGVLTMVIRRWGGYPEGVSFAILVMNAFTPLINRATKPRVFGRGQKKSKAQAPGGQG